MSVKFKRAVLINLLILSYLLFSYYALGGWWNSSAGSLLILFFSYLIWKKDFLKNTGLQIGSFTLIKTLLAAIIIIACSFLIMKHIANRNGVVIQFTNWRNYYHDVFYILNEEIVIGAILLFTLVDGKKIHPLLASTGLALFFSLIHFVFYRWIFDDRGIIHIPALTTLFLIGFVRNSLIIQTRHIGYSWALHFGWMVVMFGCKHLDKETGLLLGESEKFNTYLGSVEMLIISTIIALLTLLAWINRR